MCFASARHGQLENIFNGVVKDLQTASKNISKWDKDISKLYHQIEINKFDAARGYCLARDLQKLLRERRKAKGEFKRLRAFKTQLELFRDKSKVAIDTEIEIEKEYLGAFN